MTKASVTFVSRFYPPSPNINGESVQDLVAHLMEKNIACSIIYIDSLVGNGVNTKKAVGNLIPIKNYLNRNNKILKMIKMFLDGFLLMRKARRQKNDLIIITSAPPLLPFWANLLLKKQQKYAFWALDLFPESFAAKGRISYKNFIYKWLIKHSYKRKPEFLIALGKKQQKYLEEKCYHTKLEAFILPCGVLDTYSKGEVPEWYNDKKIIFGYCGNVHDAHNPDFICDFIDAINPETQLLVLALYGSKAKSVLEYAANKAGVLIVGNVPRNQLAYIDIHLVSLLPSFTHFAVPSKAVSAVSMQKSVLFCGDESSDNWDLLKSASYLIKEDANRKKGIIEFCKNIEQSTVNEKIDKAKKLKIELVQLVHDNYNRIAEKILNHD